MIHQAAMAVDSGAAKNVLVYRAFNERSEDRFGVGVQGRAPGPDPGSKSSGTTTTPGFDLMYASHLNSPSNPFGFCSIKPSHAQ